MNFDNKIVIGTIIIASILMVGLFFDFNPNSFDNSQPANDFQDSPSSQTGNSNFLGELMADVEAWMNPKTPNTPNTTYNEISYIWLYNNTFTNIELSSHFNRYIDGVLVSKDNQTLQMALVHVPNSSIKPIDGQNLSITLGGFTKVITKLNHTISSDLTSIFPPTFMIEIAFADGNSIGLIFSEEQQILGVINGTWSLSEYSLYGLDRVEMDYSHEKTVYFQLTNSDSVAIVTAIDNFKDLIISIFL
ncbi:MAG: hypothetical protein ACXAC7_10690 [Candidatus Hodarchaeales archaeon]|jgi:hypothetical protein